MNPEEDALFFKLEAGDTFDIQGIFFKVINFTEDLFTAKLATPHARDRVLGEEEEKCQTNSTTIK